MDNIDKVEISIIVPLFNRKKTIGRCLDSLLSQTIQNIEIIVVDDGSSDNGSEVVREYEKKDSRVHLIIQKNQGAGAARNTGIQASKGEYLGFVDCDDYVEPDMYEQLWKAVRDTGAEVAVCQQKDVYEKEDGTIQVIGETEFPCKEVTVYEREQVLDWFLNYTYLCLNSVCYKLVKKSVFMDKGIRFPEEHRYAEDLVTSAGIFSVTESVVFVPESLYCYIHEADTISTSYSVKKAADVYQDMMDVKLYLKNAQYNGATDNFVLGMSFSSMRQFYASADKEAKRSSAGKELLRKWKEAKKGIRPVFRSKEVPLFHKIKVLVAYFHMDAVVCAMVRMLSSIPFFKYMV